MQKLAIAVLLAACGSHGSTPGGDDTTAPDAAGDGTAIPPDAGADPCAAQPTGALVHGDAIAVPGELAAVAVGPTGARTLAGRYTTDLAVPIAFGMLPAPTTTGYDGFVLSPDHWVTIAAGSGSEAITAVVDDGNGAIYVAGSTTSATMTLGTLHVTNPGGPAYIDFVAKLRASDGTPLWIQPLVGPTTQGTVYGFTSCSGLAASGAEPAIACSFSTGSLVYVGAGGIQYSEAAQGRSSSVVLGLDTATGEAVWHTTIGNLTVNANTSARLQPAPAGNFYATGTFTAGTLRIRSTTAEEQQAGNISTGNYGFVAELDGASGNPSWLRSIRDTTDVANDGPLYVAAAARGSTLYLAVQSSSGIDLDNGSTAAGYGAFVAAVPLATAQTATPTWLRALTDPGQAIGFAPRLLAVDACGRASLAVASVSDTSLGGIAIPAYTAGVLKLDASGQPRWYSGFAPCNAGVSCDPRSEIADLAMTPAATTVLVGKLGGLVDFGGGQVGLGVPSQPFAVEYAP